MRETRTGTLDSRSTSCCRGAPPFGGTPYCNYSVTLKNILLDVTLHPTYGLTSMVLDDTMNRAHETVAFVHGGIMKPLREIQGVAAGLRTAINFLMRGRPDPAHAHADEEMFI